jgi:hypothetical protein
VSWGSGWIVIRERHCRILIPYIESDIKCPKWEPELFPRDAHSSYSQFTIDVIAFLTQHSPVISVIFPADSSLFPPMFQAFSYHLSLLHLDQPFRKVSLRMPSICGCDGKFLSKCLSHVVIYLPASQVILPTSIDTNVYAQPLPHCSRVGLCNQQNVTEVAVVCHLLNYRSDFILSASSLSHFMLLGSSTSNCK